MLSQLLSILAVDNVKYVKAISILGATLGKIALHAIDVKDEKLLNLLYLIGLIKRTEGEKDGDNSTIHQG